MPNSATFASWEVDEDKDEVATLKYANGEVSTLVLREMRWAKMFPCKKCSCNTRGHLCCLTCRRLRNCEDDDDSDNSGSESDSDWPPTVPNAVLFTALFIVPLP